MSGGAIMMMLLAMAVLWGGLGLAIVSLSRHPDDPDAIEGDEALDVLVHRDL